MHSHSYADVCIPLVYTKVQHAARPASKQDPLASNRHLQVIMLSPGPGMDAPAEPDPHPGSEPWAGQDRPDAVQTAPPGPAVAHPPAGSKPCPPQPLLPAGHRHMYTLRAGACWACTASAAPQPTVLPAGLTQGSSKASQDLNKACSSPHLTRARVTGCQACSG